MEAAPEGCGWANDSVDVNGVVLVDDDPVVTEPASSPPAHCMDGIAIDEFYGPNSEPTPLQIAVRRGPNASGHIRSEASSCVGSDASPRNASRRSLRRSVSAQSSVDSLTSPSRQSRGILRRRRGNSDAAGRVTITPPSATFTPPAHDLSPKPSPVRSAAPGGLSAAELHGRMRRRLSGRSSVLSDAGSPPLTPTSPNASSPPRSPLSSDRKVQRRGSGRARSGSGRARSGSGRLQRPVASVDALLVSPPEGAKGTGSALEFLRGGGPGPAESARAAFTDLHTLLREALAYLEGCTADSSLEKADRWEVIQALGMALRPLRWGVHKAQMTGDLVVSLCGEVEVLEGQVKSLRGTEHDLRKTIAALEAKVESAVREGAWNALIERLRCHLLEKKIGAINAGWPVKTGLTMVNLCVDQALSLWLDLPVQFAAAWKKLHALLDVITDEAGGLYHYIDGSTYKAVFPTLSHAAMFALEVQIQALDIDWDPALLAHRFSSSVRAEHSGTLLFNGPRLAIAVGPIDDTQQLSDVHGRNYYAGAQVSATDQLLASTLGGEVTMCTEAYHYWARQHNADWVYSVKGEFKLGRTAIVYSALPAVLKERKEALGRSRLEQRLVQRQRSHRASAAPSIANTPSASPSVRRLDRQSSSGVFESDGYTRVLEWDLRKATDMVAHLETDVQGLEDDVRRKDEAIVSLQEELTALRQKLSVAQWDNARRSTAARRRTDASSVGGDSTRSHKRRTSQNPTLASLSKRRNTTTVTPLHEGGGGGLRRTMSSSPTCRSTPGSPRSPGSPRRRSKRNSSSPSSPRHEPPADLDSPAAVAIGEFVFPTEEPSSPTAGSRKGTEDATSAAGPSRAETAASSVAEAAPAVDLYIQEAVLATQRVPPPPPPPPSPRAAAPTASVGAQTEEWKGLGGMVFFDRKGRALPKGGCEHCQGPPANAWVPDVFLNAFTRSGEAALQMHEQLVTAVSRLSRMVRSAQHKRGLRCRMPVHTLSVKLRCGSAVGLKAGSPLPRTRGPGAASWSLSGGGARKTPERRRSVKALPTPSKAPAEGQESPAGEGSSPARSPVQSRLYDMPINAVDDRMLFSAQIVDLEPHTAAAAFVCRDMLAAQRAPAAATPPASAALEGECEDASRSFSKWVENKRAAARTAAVAPYEPPQLA